MHRVAFSVDDIDEALEIAARHGCHPLRGVATYRDIYKPDLRPRPQRHPRHAGRGAGEAGPASIVVRCPAGHGGHLDGVARVQSFLRLPAHPKRTRRHLMSGLLVTCARDGSFLPGSRRASSHAQGRATQCRRARVAEPRLRSGGGDPDPLATRPARDRGGPRVWKRCVVRVQSSRRGGAAGASAFNLHTTSQRPTAPR